MDEIKFQPFHKTYRVVTFGLWMGIMYPNPKTELNRKIAILLTIISLIPLISLGYMDMHRFYLEEEYIEIIRDSIVLMPFTAVFFKMTVFYWNRAKAQKLLEEIDRDHELLNSMPQKYKKIATNSIRTGQIYCEVFWTFIVIFVTASLPVVAILLNIYEFTFKDEPVKHMVYDIRKPFAESEARFESPYFEFMFVYTCYACGVYSINFIGFDGFFGLVTNHACMKMELYCEELADAALGGDDEEVRKRIVKVIEEQCRLFRFVDLIQDIFNFWLGIIFFATVVEICTCLYQITEGYEFDLRFSIITVGAIVHIYLPCRYASNIKATSVETATKFYCCGWEKMRSLSNRKIILFMIARAQIPLNITVFNMFVFDMELFVTLLRSSYSMYTLLLS